MAPHVFNDLLTRKLSQVSYNYYKNETFALGMVVLAVVSQQDVQSVYKRNMRSFDMNLFERMKEEIRRIETDNRLEKNFLRFVVNYMLNIDERKRPSPKSALNLLSKLVKKYSGEEESKQTMTLIEEAKEGGLGEYLSKKEEGRKNELAGAGGEETKEAGRVQTMREILKKQTEQLEEEEGRVINNGGKKKKKRKKKKKKKNFLERLSLMNLKKIQKKISKANKKANKKKNEEEPQECLKPFWPSANRQSRVHQETKEKRKSCVEVQ